MGQHGRHAGPPPPPPRRRFLGVSAETALVLTLVGVIAAGSAVVNAIAPEERRTRTVVGNDRVRVTEVGQGGVMPGEIKPVAIPAAVATTDPATEILIPPETIKTAPKPKKTPKPAPTPEPVPEPVPEPQPSDVPILTPPGGGGDDEEEDCALGILCPKKTAPPAQTPEPAAPPAEESNKGKGNQGAQPGPTADSDGSDDAQPPADAAAAGDEDPTEPR